MPSLQSMKFESRVGWKQREVEKFMDALSLIARRDPLVLHPDARRVLAMLYLPGQEIMDSELSRADSVIERVLGMTDEEVATILNETVGRYGERHSNFRNLLAENFALVAHHLPKLVVDSSDRRDLIGAYFTKEYSVEGAAFFNPSIVPHPDQTGLEPDQIRFILSVRAVGEGHISSIEFRTGVLTDGDKIEIDDPGAHLVTGQSSHGMMSLEFLREALIEFEDEAASKYFLSLLPEQFNLSNLHDAISSVERDELTHDSTKEIIKEIRWIASCSYRVEFDHETKISERILYPTSVDESHGMEDARFTKFTEDDGRITYLGTYTAFNGFKVKPHLIQTNDFRTFEITRLIGPAAKNKGMAIFPRRVNGKYMALSRWDRENISVATSEDMYKWLHPVNIHIPEQPWEFTQLGNCGSPIETSDGWLVITHGVGPMREYGIGAMLLDLNDPTVVLGTLSLPLLTANAEEREGYTPNVVYSCGSLLHGETLLLPYAYSDLATRFAYIPIADLLKQLQAHL